MGKYASTVARRDLKRCPFCGTIAVLQMRLCEHLPAQHRITCGNPFCRVDCATWEHASAQGAVDAWQNRDEGDHTP
jgi:hypothetical protein